MSISQKIAQTRSALQDFSTLTLQPLQDGGVSFSEYDGPSLAEMAVEIDRCKQILALALDKNVFEVLPFQHVNGIYHGLINATQQVRQLVNSRDQGNFQNAGAHVDSLYHQLHIFGVIAAVEHTVDFAASKAFYDDQARKLVDKNGEVATLSSSVRALIEPAVAGTLSASFTNRVRGLFWTRVIWAILAIAIGIWALVEANTIVTELRIVASKSPGDFWQTLAIRSLVLVPLYIGFGFLLSQYKKERDIEEEYAHKAAIAVSLPNYRDLAKDDVVKDQIASEASKVIFAPPSKSDGKETKAVPIINGVKDLIDSVGKAVKRD